METRINKYLSECGALSRRAAEAAILAGRVRVGGQLAVIGQKIDPAAHEVTLDGVRVRPQAGLVYIILNKPAGVVTTMADDRGRTCVADIVDIPGARVYPVGRLDMETEGLLILTNDGEAARALMHPSTDIAKVYHLTVRGAPTQEQMETLRAPITIDGKTTRGAHVAVMGAHDGHTRLRVTISEGRNRQIRRMCEAAGLIAVKLRRVSVGEVNLGTLRPGEWRHMNHTQVQWVRSLSGRK